MQFIYQACRRKRSDSSRCNRWDGNRNRWNSRISNDQGKMAAMLPERKQKEIILRKKEAHKTIAEIAKKHTQGVISNTTHSRAKHLLLVPVLCTGGMGGYNKSNRPSVLCTEGSLFLVEFLELGITSFWKMKVWILIYTLIYNK